LESWFRDLGGIREALVALQAHGNEKDSELWTAIADLFAVLDEYDFVAVATDAATLEAEGVDRRGLVLWGVARVRNALDLALPKIAESAKRELGRDILV